MGISARANVTPKVAQQMTWAGVNLNSYESAEAAMGMLSGLGISARRIRRQVESIGEARITEREALVDRLKAMPLPERLQGLPSVDTPSLAVVMMDGGRYQRRDHFGESSSDKQHWRESKIGCFLFMESATLNTDPCPLIPNSFAHASVVQEIAKMAETEVLFPEQTSNTLELAEPQDIQNTYKAPKLVSREVIATGKNSEDFGWHLEARAWQLKFSSAERLAFVADGAKTNWRICHEHFPNATPIADLMHALSYAWSAAQAISEDDVYSRWAQLLWQGDVQDIVRELDEAQRMLGTPPKETPSSDPRQRIARALTYFRNNADHMHYADYRRAGLPITSSHMESTVKQINGRIKGTEKFWQTKGSECVLQLRGDYLSDSLPINRFWTRWQANTSGSNHYKTAS